MLFSKLKIVYCIYISIFICTNNAYAANSPAQEPKTATNTSHTITLVDSINATMKNHSSLAAIQENRVAVEYEKIRAERGYGPRVDVTAATGVGLLNDTTTRQNKDSGSFHPQYRMGATLTQPIWDGFATRSRVRATEATVDSLTHRVFDNATNLALDAIIAHIDVLRRREILEKSKENVDKHLSLLEIVREREREGTDSYADVAKAESRYARSQTSLTEAQAAMQDAEDTYTRLTGLRAYSALAEQSTPDLKYKDTSAIMEEAKTKNPKLAAYLEDINAARAQQELSQAAYQPTLNLEAGPNYTSRSDTAKTWTYSFDVMGVVRWNVFNSGADAASDKAGAARVRQSRQVMYSYYDDLDLSIRTTWTSFISASEQYKLWLEATRFNAITVEAYNQQFLMGQRTLLDLLDAESELYNSTTQAITTRNNVAIAIYRLEALAGTLLPTLEVPTQELFETPPPAPRDPREKY